VIDQFKIQKKIPKIPQKNLISWIYSSLTNTLNFKKISRITDFGWTIQLKSLTLWATCLPLVRGCHVRWWKQHQSSGNASKIASGIQNQNNSLNMQKWNFLLRSLTQSRAANTATIIDNSW